MLEAARVREVTVSTSLIKVVMLAILRATGVTHSHWCCVHC
jgi:hypothetical protein